MRWFVLAAVVVGCAGSGDGSSQPSEDPAGDAVREAEAVVAACKPGDDLRDVGRAWARLCRYPSAPGLEDARVGLDACRHGTVEAMVPAQAWSSPEARAKFIAALSSDPAAPIDLDAPLTLDNCPAPPAESIADLEVFEGREYAIEDGLQTTVTFTNFCPHGIQYGFSPDDEGGPPLVWTSGPRQRRPITLPRGYRLRARVDGDKRWPDAVCKATPNGYLTFHADCETCSTGREDPFVRGDCTRVGACLP